MTEFSRYQGFFYTQNVTNLGFETGDSSKAQPLLEARIVENFRVPFINKADDYVMAVERFEVNANGVPFYEAGRFLQAQGFVGTETLVINAKAGGLLQTIDLTINSFSLPDTMEMLNLLSDTTDTDPSFTFNWTVDSEGFVFLLFDPEWFEDFRLDLSNCPVLNSILGFDFSDEYQDGQEEAQDPEFKSRFPRWDCGDALGHLRITSNLPVVSDSLGQAKTNILTDLATPSAIGASWTYVEDDVQLLQAAASYSQRQRFIYNPGVRRYLNLRSAAPIEELDISAEYVRPDGTSAIILLPVGCCFSIKLGFWLRN